MTIRLHGMALNIIAIEAAHTSLGLVSTTTSNRKSRKQLCEGFTFLRTIGGRYWALESLHMLTTRVNRL
jgi:hypothetical protein